MADGIKIKLDVGAFEARIKKYLIATNRSVDEAVRELSFRVRSRLLAYTPVDTGALLKSWVGPRKTRSGKNPTYVISTDKEYAPALEFGLYRGVGPRTIKVQGRRLGLGYQAPAGIYSLQAVHGMVQRALADEYKNLEKLVSKALTKHWS